MTDLRKAAEMALEALEDIFGKEKKDVGAINELRQALAQPEWIGFTDVERNNLAMGVIAQVQTVGANMAGITNAILFIEEKLQEKNT
jgi:hypothetical protein